MSALRAVLGASRPFSWVNTAYPFAVAYLLSGGGTDATLVVGTLFFLVPYNLAMYGINDVYDYESDLLNPRKGGVEGTVAARERHRLILLSAVLSCAPFLAGLVAIGTLASTLALAVVMLAVVAYSAPRLRFKEVPFLDSATSATHFVGPAVVGLLLAGGEVTAPAVGVLAAFFAWSMASQAFGAVQDIVADRAAGLASIATVLGARATVRVALGLYALAAVLMLALAPGAYRLLAVVPVLYAVSIAPFAGLPDDHAERAHAGWRRFLWLNMVAGAIVTITILAVARSR